VVIRLDLSIVITVVSGTDSLSRCLGAMIPQMGNLNAEIIVPWDSWCRDVERLAADFPAVRFLYVEHEGLCDATPALQHRLYDHRRAKGLAACKGRIVAMTEDHAVPAADWCRSIMAVHEQLPGTIGGAIDNEVDRAINWAWYYCDFGRYGRPLAAGPSEYVSDVNVSYKREALEALRDVWNHEYHETNVHWTLRQRGYHVLLDPRLLVFQHRPPMSLGNALRERVQWGRVFAQTRIRQGIGARRMLLAFGTVVLPLVLLMRALGHMMRQQRSAGQILRTLPLLKLLLIAWSWGEFLGYAIGDRSQSCQAATA